MVEFDEDKQNKKIDLLYKKEEENLANILASRYGLSYADLSGIGINTNALRLFTEDEARKSMIACFDIVAKKVSVAVLSPQKEETVLSLKSLTDRGYIPTVYMVSKASLEKAWSRYKDLSFATETKAGSLDISNEQISEFINKVKTLDDIKAAILEIINTKKSAKVSHILEIILAGAISTDASDIHLEPEDAYVRLRFRLDGVLIDVLKLSRENFTLLLSRIKLLSGLKLNIKNNAQDGRFSVKIADSDIEIRTSILPGAYDESIVMRLLNPKTISVPMEDLGIEPKLLKILEHEIRKPNGMILNTGPTGSGKTTTLYAFLKKIHNPEIKIITIEDPIEYHLPGIVQTQTDTEKGYSFLNGLRSALRQDPDVIMVGEIRDEETAEIAINSSLTGHLVFSTLHTNNAAGAYPRLIDLGVNPKIITSALNIVIAQRLVRKVCQKCKKSVPIPENRKPVIKQILDGIVDKSVVPKVQNVWEAVGCVECHNTGYKGRIGIFEAVLNGKEVENVVKENPSEREIRKAVANQGILTLRQDGILKALNGITTIDELERVLDLENEN